MGEVCTATLATEQLQKSFSTKEQAPNEGVLEVNGNEYSVFVYQETASISKGVSEFLSEMQEGQLPELQQPDPILFEATPISIADADLFEQIQQMLMLLSQLQTMDGMKEASKFPKETSQTFGTNAKDTTNAKENSQSSTLSFNGKNTAEMGTSLRTTTTHSSEFLASTQQKTAESQTQPQVVYSSLFSLARAVNQAKLKGKETRDEATSSKSNSNRSQETRSAIQNPPTSAKETPLASSLKEESSKDREKEQGKEKNEQGNQEKDQQQDERKRKPYQDFFGKDGSSKKGRPEKKGFAITEVSMGRRAGKDPLPPLEEEVSSSQNKKAAEEHGGIDSIYIRFMALMSRILGQAEAEAHQLYLRIKERTDDIDRLTLLISKINSSKGAIDWSNDEEMKQLIEKSRGMGVDIPQGKYKWSEDEKKMLKENIQMRKDSMEKITQLERTDMQRFLQEASQCHQARSNVLKLLKEVMDTIIHNMRP